MTGRKGGQMRGEEDKGSWKGYIIYGILLFFPSLPPEQRATRIEGERRKEVAYNALASVI